MLYEEEEWEEQFAILSKNRRSDRKKTVHKAN